MAHPPLTLIVSLFCLHLIISGVAVSAASFKIVNKCRRTIWPGFLSGAGTSQLSTTGFTLRPGKSRTVSIPESWSGRLWARTHCSLTADHFSCVTGDCGSGIIECAGGGAKPPTTLAEFTLNGTNGLDFYDVSLVDGFNLPVLILPRRQMGSRGDCTATGCLVNLNGKCHQGLRVVARGRSVACRSACEAFRDPVFCCSEAYGTPDTCRPSVYSKYFKEACPRAYSYAYDDQTSTFTCGTPEDYLVIFCPLPYTSQKVLGMHKVAAGVLPLVNKTMMYLGE